MAKGNGHLEWESSKDEKYAERWWTQHGYDWKLMKRFISKSVYAVTKGDLTVNYEIPNGNLDMHRFMEGPAGFTHYWQIQKDYRELLEHAKAAGIKA